jgi:molybdopterin synthase sulfur carrier subunit
MATVLFFGPLGELAQSRSIDLPLSAPLTVSNLVENLAGKIPSEAVEALDEKTVMVSVNHKVVNWQTEVNDGDEVAFLPPVSGG